MRQRHRCGRGHRLARYTLRAAAVYDPDPAAVISNLNTVLCQEYHANADRYCTVVFGVLSGAAANGERTAAIASGGHPAPLLARADGRTGYQESAHGPLVGVFPEARYFATTLTLSPGDTLLLYSDGIIEARTGGPGHIFGEQALLEAVTAVTPADPARLVAALTGLLTTLGDSVDDDVALMALCVSPPGNRSAFHGSGQASHDAALE